MWRQARQAQERRQRQQQQDVQHPSPFRGHPASRRGGPRGPRGNNRFRGQPQQRGRGHGPKGAGDTHQGVLNRPKPWVDYHLQTQKYLLESMRKQANTLRTKEAFEKFRDQRAKVNRLENDLMQIFFRNNPSQERFWLPLLAMEASRQQHYCDLCELDFKYEDELLEHENEHQICGLEGCTFTANEETLETHILAIHASGIYSRMVHGYDEKDIKKWREDRKEKFPTVAIVKAKEDKLAEKKRQRETMKQRFEEEREERKRWFDEQRKRIQEEVKSLKTSPEVMQASRKRPRKHRKRRRQDDANDMKTKFQRKLQSVESEDESDPEGWCLGIPLFRGIHSLRKEEKSEQGESEDKSKETEETEGEDHNEDNKQAEEQDDESAPEEAPIDRIESTEVREDDEDEVKKEPEEAFPRECTEKRSVREEIRVLPHYPRSYGFLRPPKRPPTLLERLLAQEIQEERTELLQSVKYIVENKFFGVGKENQS